MALMDGRAWTATELSVEAGVAPSTASAHLRTLRDAGLIRCAAHGRHRYFELSDGEVADVLEGLTDLAARRERCVIHGTADQALRAARVCYDHLAGEAGVRLLASLRRGGVVVGEHVLQLSERGGRCLLGYGIDLQKVAATRRPVCRACLDWTERRPHLGGALGAALLRVVFQRQWAERDTDGRAVRFSTRGSAAFDAFIDALSG